MTGPVVFEGRCGCDAAIDRDQRCTLCGYRWTMGPTLPLVVFLHRVLTAEEESYRDWLGDYYENDHSVRMLAELEAKRQLIAIHWDLERVVEDPAAEEGLSMMHGGECAECHHQSMPCQTLRVLASVYADERGYLEEWAL